MGDDGQPGHGESAPRVRPGALSALLAELAQAPDGGQGTEETAGFAPGMAFGRFELVREIGHGGFGVVYEARDRDLGRSVAFKAVRAGAGSPALREERFHREAEAAARLSHPNLVTLHDVGRCEAGPYLVLELLKGRTLSERLGRGAMPLAEALDVAVQVARGLAHAHAHGVIHRDLKPANVFLCDGGLVKILDFGLAHAFGQRRAEGGTPAYMAPEQWRSAPEDERTDVFALGVMLYRMLAGEVPFPGDSSGKGLLSARSMPALEVAEAPGLGDLATRMLARDPVDRPRDGAEVLASLEAIQEQVRASNPGRTPSSSTGPSARMRRSHPFRWAVLGAVAVLALGGAIAAYVRLRGGPVAGRTLVAVADMQNGTGDPELDGLSGLLVTSLEQSRRIGVMTRGRMMDLARSAGHEKVVRIDEAVGRDIGRKAGATALLVANVHRLGTTYAIEVRAIDPLRDAYIFTLRDQSPSKEGIIPLIDRMSDQVRREFHEPAGDLAGNRARLESMVTGNLDAYRHYFVARTLIEGIHHPEAVVELERALAVDPGFALAHYQLSRMGGLGEIDEATRRRHEEAALRAKDRLPPRERGLLLASSASEAGRLDESEAGYRQLARDFPDDPEVLLPLGELLLVQERPVEAAVFLERAVDLEPTNEVAMAYLLRALGFLGRSEELLAAARRAVAAAPGPAAELFLAEALLWAGDPAGAAGAARRAIALGEGQARVTLAVAGLRSGDSSAVREAALPDPAFLAAIALFQGRLQAARVSLEEEVAAGGWNAQLALERVHLRVGIGPGPELRGASDRLAATGSPNVGSAAAAVAWAGEMEAAARLASPLRPALASAALYRAVVLRRESRLEEALPALRTLATTHASDSSFLDSFFLGEAALAAGRPEEAAQALARFQRMNVPVHVLAWAYPRSLLLLARAEEARGRLPEARAALERLGRAWSDADPGSPPLAELAELRERLAR